MALKFAFKVVIGSTAIYYTRELEIWEPLSHEERAYDKAFAEAKKFINENKPASLNLELPSVVNQDLCATTNYYYNKGLLNSIEFLNHLPCTVGNLYDSAVKQLPSLQK